MKETGKVTRLLILTSYLICPPISGGAMRMINPMVRLAQKKDYRITYLFQYHDEGQLKTATDYFAGIKSIDIRGVRYRGPFCLDLKQNIEFQLPLDVLNAMELDYYRELERLLQTEQFDIVQVEHSWMSWVVPLVRKITGGKIPVVLDVHNVEYILYERWLKYCAGDEYKRINHRYIRMKAWEQEVWNWYDAGLTVSPIEKQIFGELTGNRLLTWDIATGGGIDIDRYSSNEWQPGDSGKSLLYLGTLEWFPNTQGLVWFIDRVMPVIKKRYKDIFLCVAGYGKLADELLSELAGRKDIKYLGQQDDEREIFKRSSVYIVPVWIGAGARVKILTAWAAGIPVVATTIGAEGLGYTEGEDILVADEPEEFAGCVCRVMEDHDLARKLSASGRALVEKDYSLAKAVGMYDDAYQELLRRSSSGGFSIDIDYFCEKERSFRRMAELKADMRAIMYHDYTSQAGSERKGSNEPASMQVNMPDSYAWRISRSISSMAGRLFPRGTGRQRFLRLVLAGTRVIQDEGWRSFFSKTGKWIAGKNVRE